MVIQICWKNVWSSRIEYWQCDIWLSAQILELNSFEMWKFLMEGFIKNFIELLSKIIGFIPKNASHGKFQMMNYIRYTFEMVGAFALGN